MKLAAGFLIALAVSGAARAESGGCATDKTVLRSDLEARYEAVKAASEARDADKMQALLAPDFQNEDAYGRTWDTALMLRSLKDEPVGVDSKRNTTLVAVDLADGVAVVEINFEMSTVRAKSDGSKVKLEITALATDRWVCTDAVWYWQRRTAREMNVIQDGKLVQHKVRDPAP